MHNNPSMNIAPVQGQTIGNMAAQWLSSRSELISQLMGCTVTNLAFACSQLAALLLVAALVLASEAFQAYGWAVCCLLLAGRLLRPLFMEYKKGGAR